MIDKTVITELNTIYNWLDCVADYDTFCSGVDDMMYRLMEVVIYLTEKGETK